MDSFDAMIERYKKELIKYAKDNGIDTNTANRPMEKEPVREERQFLMMSDRPMPREYEGNEDTAAPVTDAVVETPLNRAVPWRDVPIPPIAPQEPPEEQEERYADYNDFVEKNVAEGLLRVQAYASRQAFPISNARVVVSKEFDSGERVFHDKLTDISGIADDMRLPTKRRTTSLTPNNQIPYSNYKVVVSHPNFATSTFLNVPIFEGIESLQPVIMLPASSGITEPPVNETEPNL